MPKKPEIIRYKDNQLKYLKIINNYNRLSKYSKFFMYKNTFYKSDCGDIDSYYIKSFSSAVEIIDKEQIKKLKIKFKNKETNDSIKCQQMIDNLCNNDQNLDSMIHTIANRYKLKTKETVIASVFINFKERENIKSLYLDYQNQLKEINKYNKNRLIFAYFYRDNIIGFFKSSLSFIDLGEFFCIDYDVFCKYLKENSITDPKIKEKHDKNKKINESNLLIKLDQLKQDNICQKELINSLNDKQKKYENDIQSMWERQKENLDKIIELRKSNKILSGKFNRIEILDILK